MTFEEIKAMLMHDLAYAEDRMKEHGELMPMFILHCEDGIRIVTAHFESENDKDLAAKFILLLGVAHNAEAIGMLSEAWLRTATDEREAINAPREEVVWISVSYRSEDARVRHLQASRCIERDRAGKFLALAPAVVEQADDSNVKVEGRFANLVSPMPASPQMRDLAKAALDERFGNIAVEIQPTTIH